MLNDLITIVRRLGRLPNIVVLTGAGISAESGIKTFRDQNGLWENHDIEDVATPRGFRKNPALVYRFYNERRKQALSCQPNLAHSALVELEQLLGKGLSLVTQNVDDLHERAGSTTLFHMHGELNKARCLGCQKVFAWTGDLDDTSKCESCGSIMRPHIVWFEEIPFFMPEIERPLKKCDIFVAIGTSGVVYPAAGFYTSAKKTGSYTIEINLQRTSHNFHAFMEGPATQSVPQFVVTLKMAIEQALG
ncbi:MAG: NAD-dependent deacylase [Oligoflexia bacterium]|nr:NAD-dependent deacylase [Oligoflexia bacterium]